MTVPTAFQFVLQFFYREIGLTPVLSRELRRTVTATPEQAEVRVNADLVPGFISFWS
jgi:hypothetical protein